MKYKILIIDRYEEMGGVKRFIKEFYNNIKKRHFVDLRKPHEIKFSELKKYDVIHVSGVSSIQTLKLLFFRKKVILTVHGWINREHSFKIKNSGFFKKFVWIAHLLIWKLFLNSIKYVTCPTINTLKENNLEKRAKVIPNAINFADYKKIKSIPREKFGLKKNDLVFFTYSSSGGIKNESVKSAIKLISEINKENDNVKLLIFGDYKNLKEEKGVINLGYRKDFLNIIKSCDMFLCTKGFPDLGYVEMQSAALRIPIIKFYQDYDGKTYLNQEINEKNGFLVKDKEECKKLICSIITKKVDCSNKGNNFYKYVLSNYSWKVVIKKWEELFKEIINEN